MIVMWIFEVQDLTFPQGCECGAFVLFCVLEKFFLTRKKFFNRNFWFSTFVDICMRVFLQVFIIAFLILNVRLFWLEFSTIRIGTRVCRVYRLKHALE